MYRCTYPKLYQSRLTVVLVFIYVPEVPEFKAETAFGRKVNFNLGSCTIYRIRRVLNFKQSTNN